MGKPSWCTERIPGESRRRKQAYRVIHQPISVVSQCDAGAWLYRLAIGDQRQLTVSGSTSEVCSRRCTIQIHRYFTLLLCASLPLLSLMTYSSRSTVLDLQKSFTFCNYSTIHYDHSVCKVLCKFCILLSFIYFSGAWRKSIQQYIMVFKLSSSRMRPKLAYTWPTGNPLLCVYYSVK